MWLTEGLIGLLTDLLTELIDLFDFDWQPVIAPYDRVFPAEEDEEKTVEDNCK